jgi:acetyl-CoA carboxylase biotin carboxyl carrier protein
MSAPSDDDREEATMRDSGLAGGGATVEPVAVGPGADDPAILDDASATLDDSAATVRDDATAASGDDGAAADPIPAPVLAGADASLLALIDRLALVLERSDLGELEVAAGATTIVLRAPSAVERSVAPAVPPASAEPAVPPAADGAAPGPQPAAAVATATRPSVKAPLTGIYYGAPSPGATAYVTVGDHLSVGQVIGLIEAMKLFNEIKSDLAGRVARVCVENGALVKARQPLIEVEPA